VANADRGAQYLDSLASRAAAVIDGNSIDWSRYFGPEEKSRIIPAEALAERGRRELALGAADEDGLAFPWTKTAGKVLVRPGKLVIWAGYTHHGKTQMVKQLMLHAIGQSEKALVASMEEEVLDVWKDMARLACANQEPMPKDVDRYTEFVRGNLWLYDQEGMVDPRKIQAVIRYAAKELRVTQAVVDSLMMLGLDKDDYDAQARFVGELKTTAKDTGVTVHLVAHMRKRDGKTGDESPGSIHDIAGGHEIASKADYVFLVWRDKQKKPDCHLKVDKQRGRINWLGTVTLNYHQGSRQFVEDVHPMRFWEDDGQPF
jgi:twinkle protein